MMSAYVDNVNVEWSEGAVPSVRSGLWWCERSMKVLGIYQGTEEYQKRNWVGVLETVSTRNISCLTEEGFGCQAPGLVEEVLQLRVDLDWSGRCWIQAAALYLPSAER